MNIRELGLYTKINGHYRQVLTVHEVAKKLGITRQNVLKHINKGNIAAVRLTGLSGGTLYLVPKIEIKKIKT